MEISSLCQIFYYHYICLKWVKNYFKKFIVPTVMFFNICLNLRNLIAKKQLSFIFYAPTRKFVGYLFYASPDKALCFSSRANEPMKMCHAHFL